jgi:hypothetical protein
MNSEYQKATMEEKFWAGMQELKASQERSQAAFDRRMNKMEQKARENDAKWERQMAESDAKWERRMARSDAKWDKLHEDIAKLRISIGELKGVTAENKRNTGGIGNSNGDFAEEFFHNSLKKGSMEFFGEKFDRVERNRIAGADGRADGEYDNVLYNGKAICIVEVKYKAQKGLNFNHIIERVNIFKRKYPAYAGHRYYLALAAFSFDDGIVKKCSNKGIAVFKPQGDTLAVYDKNLKVF